MQRQFVATDRRVASAANFRLDRPPTEVRRICNERSWGEPTRHQVFFADLSGGDKRQVWARDLRREPGADLFYLKESGARAVISEALVPGVLACPFPGCPCPVFKSVIWGVEVRDHFRQVAERPDDDWDLNLTRDGSSLKRWVTHVGLAEWS